MALAKRVPSRAVPPEIPNATSIFLFRYLQIHRREDLLHTGKAQFVQSLFPDLPFSRVSFGRVEECSKSVVGSHSQSCPKANAVEGDVHQVYLRGNIGIHEKASVRLFTMTQQRVNICGCPFIHWPASDCEKCFGRHQNCTLGITG